MCPAQSRCSISGNYTEIKAETQWERTTEACWQPPWKATKMLNHQTWVEYQGHASLRPWVFSSSVPAQGMLATWTFCQTKGHVRRLRSELARTFRAIQSAPHFILGKTEAQRDERTRAHGQKPVSAQVSKLPLRSSSLLLRVLERVTYSVDFQEHSMKGKFWRHKILTQKAGYKTSLSVSYF